jgi:TorA maturation chaperone TorD
MTATTAQQANPRPLLVRARQVLYRFASAAFADPRSGCWPALRDAGGSALLSAAAELVRAAGRRRGAARAWGELPEAWLDPQRVLRRLPTGPEALNAEYEQSFGLLVSSSHPPYEMEYVAGKLVFQRGQLLADVSGFYRAFGWRRAERPRERPDHLALELEFMAVLCEQQARARLVCREALAERDVARQRVAAEQAVVCWQAQRRFLQAHLAWWVPAFGRLLAAHRPRGFYAAAARFVRALLPLERALLRVPPSSGPLQVAQEARPEQCSGCLAAMEVWDA